MIAARRQTARWFLTIPALVVACERVAPSRGSTTGYRADIAAPSAIFNFVLALRERIAHIGSALLALLVLSPPGQRFGLFALASGALVS